MKIKSDFIVRLVAGCHVVVPTGQGAVDLNGMLRLNEVGAFLWKCLEKGCSREELLDSLLESYEIDRATAQEDIDRFVASLAKYSLLEDDCPKES